MLAFSRLIKELYIQSSLPCLECVTTKNNLIGSTNILYFLTLADETLYKALYLLNSQVLFIQIYKNAPFVPNVDI